MKAAGSLRSSQILRRCCVFLGVFFCVLAQAVTVTFNSSGTWTAPAGVTSVTVEAWGAGGGGGGTTGNPSGGGGGAGGQYAIKVLTVAPGSNYSVSVGAGGTGSTGNGGTGGDSTFAATSVVAKGGAGGAGETNKNAYGVGATGSALNGVGSTVYAGGSGSNGADGGAGGGGAGSTGNGGNASGFSGGSGTTNGGGAGGDGLFSRGSGNSGSLAGGGGGGAYATNNTDRSGGVGGAGQVIVKYVSAPTVTTDPATSLTASGATLNGTVSSNEAATTVSFEYGLTSGYGSTATASQSPLAANASNAAVSTVLSGLASNTTYHFRAKGVNSTGATVGADRTFTTLPPPTVSSIIRASFDPSASNQSVSWTVTFSQSVAGVNAADFSLIQAGGVAGAAISAVTGSGTTWSVTANTGTGTSGTLGLNLVDDDSIVSTAPLGGTGNGNGNYTGQTYTLLPSVCTGAADIIFCDDFERSNPGSIGNGWTITPASVTNCTGAAGNTGCAGIDRDIPPFNDYSRPQAGTTRSMFTRWSIVSVDSKVINLAGKAGAQLSFWMRRGGDSFSEYPEAAGENYLIEYWASDSTWKILAQYPSGVMEGQVFTPIIELPADALHSGFKIRFYQPSGSGKTGSGGATGVVGYDYWHLDDVIVREVTAPRFVGAFCDNFEAGLGRWSISAEGAPATANIGDASIGSSNYQSAAKALDMRWGYVSAATFKTDMTGITGNITYWLRSGNSTLDPITNEDLVVEYLNSTGTWTALATYLGSATAGTTYSGSHVIPANAKHANFRLRFRQLAGSGYDKSYWHLDDVCVGDLLPTADLALSKTGGTLVPGSSASYTLKVVNNGPGTLSGSMQIIDSLPTGLSFLAGSGSGWSCSANGQTVTCGWTGTLVSGASAADLTLTVGVGAGVSGSITNTATVSGTANDNVPGNNTASYTSGNFVPAYVFTDKACPDGVAIGTGTNPCYLVTWSAQNAGQNKTGLYITSVNSSGIPTKLSAASATTIGFQFGLTCHDPIADAGVQATFSATATALPLCTGNGAEPTTWSSTTNLSFPAGSPSIAAGYTFNYADVGDIELFMRNAAATNQKGSGRFISKPAGFTLAEIKPTVNPTGRCAEATTPAPVIVCASTASGAATFVRAGEAFSATVKALTSSGAAAPNFGKEKTPESVQLIPTNSVAGMVTAPDVAGNFNTFSNGVATGTGFSWGEVGIITLTPEIKDRDYLGAGNVTGTASGNIGRFIPDHFDVTVNTHGAMAAACLAGGFTYTGQPMGYAGASLPALTIKPMNAVSGGSVTQNYQGGFQKLVSNGVTITSPVADVVKMGLDGTTKTALTAAMSTGSIINTAGTLTYTLALADQFTYTRNANALIGSYTTQIPLIVTAVSDGEASAVAGALPTLNPAGVSLRYGRLRVFNAFGSENANLSMPVRAEYWTGLSWLLNSNDSCSLVPITSVALTKTGAAGTAVSSNLTLSGGQGSIILTKPTTTGTVDLAINLDVSTTTTDLSCLASHPATVGAGLSWLRSLNGSCLPATPNRDPSARGNFGIYSPETKKTIHIRELY